MISVVVPCFNEPADRLRRTLESALESIDSSRGDSVVVVNDAGQAPDVGDLPVRLVNLTSNRGPSGAVNSGCLAARGRYIARVDVGDVFYPEAKARQFAAVIAGDVAASFSHSVNELTGEVWPLHPKWQSRIYRDGQFRVSTCIVRRDVWELAQWDGSLRYHDDWGWTVRVQHVTPWTLHDEVTGTATMLPGGWSDRAKRDDARRDRIRVLKMAQKRRWTRPDWCRS